PAARRSAEDLVSRSNWPLRGATDDRGGADAQAYPAYAEQASAALDRRPDPGQHGERDRQPDRDPQARPAVATGRVKPPWQSDDLPPEPPMLRLVEPTMAEPTGAGALGRASVDPLRDPVPAAEGRLEQPPLRLIDGEADGARGGRSRRPTDLASAPVGEENDGDLLIFAAARSAWFVGQAEEETDVDWSTEADQGWRAAEQAARPAVGAETPAGLPKRVPQANLVPGSPLREERPLRIVRDPASIAAHTTGYFQGWRRGQEIGGYAVGGRPGREAAGGWDFSRDPSGRDEAREYEYRSAGYSS
ncbi:MAG TPA: transposase, partial [Pilimelia sp.]|nr:transposase [Pilimelia sp.]